MDQAYSETPETVTPPFWLDILNPTDSEMKILSRTFGIHPLTAEDIMLGESREKIEIFGDYYLIVSSTMQQRIRSQKYMSRVLEPVNLYIVVFKEGVLTFHHSPLAHPANVRRRIRQLREHISVSADWIAYALIDDVTDHFEPLMDATEQEVLIIDNDIIKIFSNASFTWKQKGDMLIRIGECRKRVMALTRLVSSKADVVKSFSKRCQENWDAVPAAEVALYLGDIQDHVVTMTQSLNHYEKLLSRSHSNYLAQINIEMTQVNNDTNEVLGHLTVLGTIVLPMNIVTGLWGMNVKVPGQEIDSLTWFNGIVLGLMVFGILFYLVFSRLLLR
ncbi:hypothetical protein CANCADRAFT_28553 [Tortispora caseinolytica NRRL Y-17796]|uniref:Magnesium transporter n=1 Tax=Tortispora caseinolytica NRRL Y-17796 TaxID=767744 RepID=A0A1E4TA97_9ASCO|nr:hypothetical protein CANCADRAFT_28553 [Tortispora caseinolytica NRRL Y-17796]